MIGSTRGAWVFALMHATEGKDKELVGIFSCHHRAHQAALEEAVDWRKWWGSDEAIVTDPRGFHCGDQSWEVLEVQVR